jgi:hypothetical protein
MARVWFAIQAALNAAANVSKSLWGQRGRLSDRRKELRESLGVAEDSSLRGVYMRNHFEHFDERLDEWWEKSVRHNVVDHCVGDVQVNVVDLDLIDTFRNYDPRTGDLIFWGDRFNLKDLEREISGILQRS